MSTAKSTKNFLLELVTDGVPYEVRGQVFDFNEEKRVRLSVNNGDEHIYAWDAEAVGLQALDDEASVLPGNLEREISDYLVKTVIIK